jgi:hypothetical protein
VKPEDEQDVLSDHQHRTRGSREPDVPERLLFHYTDDVGYKGIGVQRTWVFRAARPPGDHPIGAYFTTLGPCTIKLAKRLRIPKSKLSFVFCFSDAEDLIPLEGDRGEFRPSGGVRCRAHDPGARDPSAARAQLRTGLAAGGGTDLPRHIGPG